MGLDSNVVIRYAVRDDEDQAGRADAVVDGLSADSPGYVSLVVLTETWWVLDRAYAIARDRRLEFFEALLDAQELRTESPDLVRAALRRTRRGADFADALITEASAAAGCTRVMTLDERAAKHAGMTLIT
ncbi:PIN domain-containing protein [Mumia zhuanghuii]|uniref:PIN domain-containing protein n=1 Tax=Mumia zhuanghuii TaxID=2585211 RepID=UPI00364318DC